MKIRIFGATASGKTTLAHFLGEKLNIPVYCTDKIKYPDSFDTELPEKERIKLLKNLKKSWIVEGVHYEKWCRKTYVEADVIIVMKRPFFILIYRIMKRCWKQEKGHYEHKFRCMKKLIKMLFKYANKEFIIYKKIANDFNKPLIVIKNNNYEKVLNELKNKF